MKVSFEFKDKDDTVTMANNIEKEIDNSELLILMNSKELSYPIKMGDTRTFKNAIIENIEYDMYTEPYTLRIALKEK